MPKVSVNSQRGRLYLLCRLPHRHEKEGPLRQQRLTLGLDDTPSNRKVADKRRIELQRQIDLGTFAWSDWIEPSKGVSWRQAIELLYRKRVVNGRTGQNTWEISYMGRLRQMDMSAVVTTEGVAKALAKYERDTASYKEFFYLLKDLCRLVPVAFPEVPVPTYGLTSSAPDVPSDEEIVALLARIDPELAWHLGVMATYGLRPHELDKCEFICDKHRLMVADDTKTGGRIVVPCPLEWVDKFNLRSERRRLQEVDKADSTSKWLYARKKTYDIEFKPYVLRHSYAGRLWRTGGPRLDIYTAARLMGHSVKVHEKTYRAWITPYTIAEKAEESLYTSVGL
jgi:integrase